MKDKGILGAFMLY